uniref:Uncharacterized protein n=1 Tax=Rhizophora mucronata TaxID=61149 RepID=A0A2P2Q5R6_RHIMU
MELLGINFLSCIYLIPMTDSTRRRNHNVNI